MNLLHDDYFDVRGKVMASDSWDGLLRDTGGRMSRLMEFADGRQRMTKSASECFSREFLNSVKPDDNHFLIHYVAMGAHERYGFNRNGDSFKRAELIDRHPTFVSDGAYFREHKNHDKKHAIGIIKASAYNEAMDRAELLVEADKEKAASEYEKAKKGDELSGSMACRIKGDVCNICDHFSRRTAEYCKHAKDSMTRYLPEFGKYAFVFNPQPTFIDYSSVRRPADRIAHYIAYVFGPGNEMQKAAAEDTVITSSDWAEYYGQGPVNRQVEDAIEKLAASCRELRDPQAVMCATVKAAFIRDVVGRAQPGELNDNEIDALRRLRPQTLWYNLSKRAAVLPFRTFCSYLLNKPVADISEDAEIKAARAMLLEIPDQLKTACGVEFMRRIMGQFLPCCGADADSDPEHDDAIDRILEIADDKFSVDAMPVHNRVVQSEGLKAAALDAQRIVLPAESFAGTLAMAYGVYKASALATMDGLRGENPGRDFIVAALT